MVCHYLVKGRVQGVGFRWFVQREAAEIGLRGWVRNTDDGHVEIVAAGEPDELGGVEGCAATRVRAAAAWMQYWKMNWPRAKARSLGHLRLKEPGKN